MVPQRPPHRGPQCCTTGAQADPDRDRLRRRQRRSRRPGQVQERGPGRDRRAAGAGVRGRAATPSLSRELVKTPSLTVYWLVFRVTSAPLNNVKVRRAIAAGDRPQRPRRPGLPGPGDAGRDASSRRACTATPRPWLRQKFDVAQARATLASSGVTAAAAPRASSSRTTKSSDFQKATATFVRDQLKANLGVDITPAGARHQHAGLATATRGTFRSPVRRVDRRLPGPGGLVRHLPHDQLEQPRAVAEPAVRQLRARGGHRHPGRSRATRSISRRSRCSWVMRRWPSWPSWSAGTWSAPTSKASPRHRWTSGREPCFQPRFTSRRGEKQRTSVRGARIGQYDTTWRGAREFCYGHVDRLSKTCCRRTLAPGPQVIPGRSFRRCP